MRQILIDIDGAWKTMCGECCYLQPTATGERGKWCDIFCVASDIDATDMPRPAECLAAETKALGTATHKKKPLAFDEWIDAPTDGWYYGRMASADEKILMRTAFEAGEQWNSSKGHVAGMMAFEAGWKSAMEQVPTIPPHLALVPREPTEEMLYLITPASASYNEWRANYKAMLSAWEKQS